MIAPRAQGPIINKIEVFFTRKNLQTTMRISRGGFTVRLHALVKVTTDSGLVGWGEGIGNAALVKNIIETYLAPEVLGQDAFNLVALRTQILHNPVYFERKGSVLCALSAIETACWDIKGKALGVPCYQLLGGLAQDRLPAYASDVYWEKDIETVANSARRIVALGYKIIKAHLGFASADEDTARVRAIREAIGPDIKLMIDLNAGYDLMDARRAVKLWEPFDLTWLEEPLEPDLIGLLADLRRHSPIPIAAGENEFQIHGFKQLFEAGSLDVAMPDIGRVGGLLEAQRICTLAAAFGIPVSPHNFSSGILLAATAHLMAATPNTTWLEMDTSGNAIYLELLDEGWHFENGFLSVSNSPGLGVSPRPEILEPFLVSV